MIHGLRPVPHLTMWTIYDHPKDHPDHYIARKWLMVDGLCLPTEETFADPDLDMVRSHLMNVAAMSVPLVRADGDDPVIVETWI